VASKKFLDDTIAMQTYQINGEEAMI